MLELGASPAVAQLLDRLEGADCRPRASGAGWLALCPAHDDRSPSLSVAEGSDGRALVHCFAGCPVDTVLGSLGLRSADLFGSDASPREFLPNRPTTRHRPAEIPSAEQLQRWERQLHESPAALELAYAAKRWPPGALAALDIGWDGERFTLPIRDRNGQLVNVCRYLPGGNPKMLALRGRPRDLFPSPEQLSEPPHAAARGPVYIVEGEPDAISGASACVPAVAIPGVDGWRSSWAERFADRDVRVLTDHDDPGRRLAEQAGRDLVSYAASVRLLSWPAIIGAEPPEGYDLGACLLERGKAAFE